MPLSRISSSANLIGHPFIILESVDSTNNYAMGLVNEGRVSEGAVFLARRQTAGKGQRGKHWLSTGSLNLTLSVVLQPVMLHPADQFLLSAAISLGVCDFLMQYADPHKCRIKWSNDIYWGDRKAGGILIENAIRGNIWNFAVVGIGLNVNQVRFPKSLPNPVSLKAITGKSWDILSLALPLCSALEARYLQLQAGFPGKILEEYTNRLFLLNTPAHFKTGAVSLKGIIRGIKADGKILVQAGDSIRDFGFGELELIG